MHKCSSFITEMRVSTVNLSFLPNSPESHLPQIRFFFFLFRTDSMHTIEVVRETIVDFSCRLSSRGQKSKLFLVSGYMKVNLTCVLDPMDCCLRCT